MCLVVLMGVCGNCTFNLYCSGVGGDKGGFCLIDVRRIGRCGEKYRTLVAPMMTSFYNEKYPARFQRDHEIFNVFSIDRQFKFIERVNKACTFH